MAYVDFSAGEFAGSTTARHAPPEPSADPFTDLEWTVVRLARQDRPSSTRSPGRLRRAFRWIFATKPTNQLADPRLEALRRFSIIAWRRRGPIPPEALSELESAGFSVEQGDALVRWIATARLA
jgi:hypothetical protein